MIYDRIKEICKARGITIRTLERDLEFGRGSVRQFDQHDPSVGKMHMIAGYLGVTVDDLLDNNFDVKKIRDDAALQIYSDKDMRDIYEIKKGMVPERFAVYKKLLTELYKAEMSERSQDEEGGEAGESEQ